MLSHPSGFGGFVPGGVLFAKDLERSLTILVQGGKVIFDVVITNQLFLELGHRERTVVLEASHELAIVAVEKVHTGLDEVRLSEGCFNHVYIMAYF